VVEGHEQALVIVIAVDEALGDHLTVLPAGGHGRVRHR
jgi:hypothetical protein